MKSIHLVSILAIILTALSCDTEDSREPLGITVSAADFEITIEENPEEGTLLGVLEAFASDGSTIQYGNIVAADSEDSKFQSETPIGALDINNETGELTVKDSSLFDFTLNTEINATINAISGQVEEAININIFLNPDRRVLIDILTENPTATLSWDNITTETDISNLPGVTVTDGRIIELDLSRVGITSIPNSISNLSQITILNLSNNDISSLPESLASLSNLSSLDISSNPNLTLLSSVICDAFNSFESDTFIKDDEAICPEEVPDEATSSQS